MPTLDQRLLDLKPAIEGWFETQWDAHAAPIYSSVDVRNAGFKLAPVDTNLFPGGWNNLSPAMLPMAAQALQRALAKIHPQARRLLIVPENHTRNSFYWMNIARLKALAEMAGLHVRVGSAHADVLQASPIALPEGESVQVEPLFRHRHRVALQDFDPCVVLLNNDLSSGVPMVLNGLTQQTLTPPLHAGWHVRRKHQHFEQYALVSARFGQALGLDPWLIDPLFSHCDGVDFDAPSGVDELQSHVADLLGRIRVRYQAHGIDERPFVMVKADNGTYGMGIMTVHNAAQLGQLNRKTRNKMKVVKEGQAVSEVLIQEGITSRERVGHSVAEPVVYLINGEVVGGFYRANAGRGVDENLNAPGASFTPLALTSQAQIPAHFYANSVVARLATLAASAELACADSHKPSPSSPAALEDWQVHNTCTLSSATAPACAYA